MSRTFNVPVDSAPLLSVGYPVFAKDPAAVLDYTFDWSAWLAGDTVASATWAIVKESPQADTAPLTKGTASTTATTTTQFVSAGQAGVTYLLECTMTTVGGRTAVRAVQIAVSTLPQ